MALCSNCGGTGRILIADPQNPGKIIDVGACMACQGSGQTPDR